MAHPMASQSARSQAARLKRIGGKGASAGKAWGSTAMASKTATSYPSKNAGSQVPYFAEGGSVGARPDRLARGGSMKSKGKKGGHTNVVVQVPPPAAAEKVPVPVPRPVPVPVPAGAGGSPPGGPPMPPPGAMGPPPGAVPPPGLRKRGGAVGLKTGGGVPHKDVGGPITPVPPVTPTGQFPTNMPFTPGTNLSNALDHIAAGRSAATAAGLVPGSPMPGSNMMAQRQGPGPRPVPQAPTPIPGMLPRPGGMKRGGFVSDEAKEKAEEKKDAKQKGNPGEMLKRGGLVEHEEPDYDRASYIGDPIIGEDKRRPIASRPRNDFEKAATEEDPGSRGHGFPARHAKGGSIKQGGGGSAQANEPGGYPVMKNGGGGGLGRLEKAKKKTA